MSINTILILEDDYTEAEYLADDIQYVIHDSEITVRTFHSIGSIDQYIDDFIEKIRKDTGEDDLIDWSNVCLIIDLNMNPFGLKTADGERMNIEMNHVKYTGWIWLYSKYCSVFQHNEPTVKIYSAFVDRLRICANENFGDIPEAPALRASVDCFEKHNIKTYRKGEENSYNRLLQDIRSLI